MKFDIGRNFPHWNRLAKDTSDGDKRAREQLAEEAWKFAHNLAKKNLAKRASYVIDAEDIASQVAFEAIDQIRNFDYSCPFEVVVLRIFSATIHRQRLADSAASVPRLNKAHRHAIEECDYDITKLVRHPAFEGFAEVEIQTRIRRALVQKGGRKTTDDIAETLSTPDHSEDAIESVSIEKTMKMFLKIASEARLSKKQQNALCDLLKGGGGKNGQGGAAMRKMRNVMIRQSQ